MENLKSIYNNMSDMSKMLIKILLGIIAALLVMFMVVVIVRIVRGAGNGRNTYEKLENTLEKAAVKYYKDNDDKKPKKGEESTVQINELISGEYIKELEKYVGKETKCTGYVSVSNNNNYYLYTPYLDCGNKYNTKFLIDEILEDSPIVEVGNGLYSDEEDNYIFRGEYVNNYLRFANLDWRILRINADGTIRIILATPLKDYRNSTWDDRYNIERENNVGINDFSKSRVREKLNVIYNDKELFTDENKSLMTKQTLCVGPRNEDSDDFSGAEECSETVESDYLGLIQANEFLQVSLDENCASTLDHSCSNYNYISSDFKAFWTITPTAEDTYHNYRVSGNLMTSKTTSVNNILFTVNLSSKAVIKTGDGTLENPYVIKGDKVEKK